MNNVSILYNQKTIKINKGPHLAIAMPLLALLLLLVFMLSFYLKKTYLGRNWEQHRCDYIFMSGFLQPDSSIKPSEYTVNNLKYCIKQSIYNETPILPYIKDTLYKLNYLSGFLKKQVGIYESYVKEEVGTNTQKYNEIINNKINGLKYKQQKLTTISNKLNSVFTKSISKIQEGSNKKRLLDKETKDNQNYETNEKYKEYILEK